MSIWVKVKCSQNPDLLIWADPENSVREVLTFFFLKSSTYFTEDHTDQGGPTASRGGSIPVFLTKQIASWFSRGGGGGGGADSLFPPPLNLGMSDIQTLKLAAYEENIKNFSR